MPTIRLSRLLATTALLGGLIASAQAQFSSLTVFGDSLSDIGNNALIIGRNPGQVVTGNSYVPIQPYASGTYSDGWTWSLPFSILAGLPNGGVASFQGGGNFAFGGALTAEDGPLFGFPFSAASQVGLYLSFNPGPLDPNGLYVIAVGGNDVRDTGDAVAADPGNAAAIVAGDAAFHAVAIGNLVDVLQSRGAENIVVWGVPDIGLTPAARSAGPAAAATASFISAAYNDVLQDRLALEPDDVRYFDLAGVMNIIVSSPSTFGLSNVTDACGAVPGCDPSTYLFWDGIHPTSAGHTLLAIGLIGQVPEPASVLLMALGVAWLMSIRRRA